MITLHTVDHGNVVLPEPTWCAGHTHHDPETERADLIHAGPAVDLIHLGDTLLSAELVASPYATSSAPELGGPTPGVSVHPLGQTLNPTALYCLAADLDRYSDQLRALADQLATVLDGGDHA